MAGNLKRNVVSTLVETTLLVPLLISAGLELGHYAAKIELIDQEIIGLKDDKTDAIKAPKR